VGWALSRKPRPRPERLFWKSNPVRPQVPWEVEQEGRQAGQKEVQTSGVAQVAVPVGQGVPSFFPPVWARLAELGRRPTRQGWGGRWCVGTARALRQRHAGKGRGMCGKVAPVCSHELIKCRSCGVSSSSVRGLL